MGVKKSYYYLKIILTIDNNGRRGNKQMSLVRNPLKIDYQRVKYRWPYQFIPYK